MYPIEFNVMVIKMLTEPGRRMDEHSENFNKEFNSVQFAQSCLTLCDPMDCSTPGFHVHHQLPELTQLVSIESVMPPNHLILCYPLLILSSIFPSTFPFFFLFLGTIDTIYNLDKNLFYSTGNSSECSVVA